MMQAAYYDIYSRDPIALAACLAYLCEVEGGEFKGSSGVAQTLNLYPVIRIWPQQNANLAAASLLPSAESDGLIWEVASPREVEQLGQRAAFYQYRQQQEGTAAAIVQSKSMQYLGQAAWQILDLDGRRWIFKAREKV